MIIPTCKDVDRDIILGLFGTARMSRERFFELLEVCKSDLRQVSVEVKIVLDTKAFVSGVPKYERKGVKPTKPELSRSRRK